VAAGHGSAEGTASRWSGVAYNIFRGVVLWITGAGVLSAAFLGTAPGFLSGGQAVPALIWTLSALLAHFLLIVGVVRLRLTSWRSGGAVWACGDVAER
jgi:hypothetical protein